MKVIETTGGPFIAISQDKADRWSGIEGKRFSGHDMPFEHDYEAGCAQFYNQANRRPLIAKFSNNEVDVALFGEPMPTCVVATDGSSAYLGQAHYAPEEWSYSEISKNDFDRAGFENYVGFRINHTGQRMVVFDSSCQFGWVDDDRLEFDLSPGRYRISAALYNPGRGTLLTLIRMLRE